MRNERWRAIHFDPIQGFGSREHYFHFLLGYLLPGLYAATARPAGIDRPDGLSFISCGPVMDARIREACSLLRLGCVIEAGPSEPRPAPSGADHVTADRWDRWLLRGRPDRLRPARWLRDCWDELIRTAVPRAMRIIRDRLLEAAKPPSGVVEADRPWLLLRRSAEPEFYRPGGPAEIASYGVGRRAIMNIEKLAGELSQAGLPVRIYEPGVADLADQIRTFRDSRGVIGLRGAELANVVWMTSGSHVVMLATPMRTETHLAWNLASTMRLAFTKVAVDSEYPQVGAATVLKAIACARIG